MPFLSIYWRFWGNKGTWWKSRGWTID